MPHNELLPQLDAAIAAKNLLKHPFYQDWQAGKLSRKALQLYASQYYRHVEAFPQHLRVLAERADASLKPVVLENLAEEENPAGPHPPDAACRTEVPPTMRRTRACAACA